MSFAIDEASLRIRLAELLEPWCTAELLDKLYGLGVASATGWMGPWRAWARRRPIEQIAQNGIRTFHRHRLETFLQQVEALPVKLAAARLGMEAQSMREVLAHYESELPRSPWLVSDELVNLSVLRDLPSISMSYDIVFLARMTIFAAGCMKCSLLSALWFYRYDVLRRHPITRMISLIRSMY